MRKLKWLYPGMNFKRWLLLFSLGVLMSSLGLAIIINFKIIGIIEEEIIKMINFLTGRTYIAVIAGMIIVILGILVMLFAIRQLVRSVTSVILPDCKDKLVDLIYQRRQLARGPHIVVIGGGTGLSVLLRGLKEYTNNLTAIVTVADDGGSSGRLRDELGILPPGDLRNCLVALADTEPLMGRLMQYRFSAGSGLAGHNFGNLLIVALTEILGDFEAAIKESSKVLAIRGEVLPATLEHVDLIAELEDGTLVEGESQISQSKRRIKRVFLRPEDSQPLPETLNALRNADAIVLGPGSLYTSVIPNLLVKGIAEAIAQSPALKIYVCNVMTQTSETDGYTAADHLKALVEHLGPGIVDYMIINTEQIPVRLLNKYAKQGAYPVKPDLKRISGLGVKVITENLLHETDFVRHDPGKLARVIIKLILEMKTSTDPMRVLDYYFLGEKMKQLEAKGEKNTTPR